MFIHRGALVLATTLSVFAGHPLQARADLTYITDFTKNNNIYTNLNEQFPNTGVGVPGTGVGTPNSTYLYNPATYTSPNFIPGSDQAASNPTTFLLASNSTGQDYLQLSFSSIPSITVPIGVFGVTTVYSLTSAYGDNRFFDVTFTGSGGATESFSNVPSPNVAGGAGLTGINEAFAVNGSATDNLFNQTALVVQDVGGGGTGNSTTGAFTNYNLTQQTYILDSQFAGQTLVSATFTTPGFATILLGLTVSSESSIATPEPNSLLLVAFALSTLPTASLFRRMRAMRESSVDAGEAP